MSDRPKHIQLVIDGNKKSAHIESVADDKVVEIDQEQIMSFETRLALNGGFAVTISYRNGASDVLVFENKKELLIALSNILRD